MPPAPKDHLPSCDILVLSWGHDVPPVPSPPLGPRPAPGALARAEAEPWRDPMWDALRAAFLGLPVPTAATGTGDGGEGGGGDTPAQGLPEGTPYRREIFCLLRDLPADDAFQARRRRPAPP